MWGGRRHPHLPHAGGLARLLAPGPEAHEPLDKAHAQETALLHKAPVMRVSSSLHSNHPEFPHTVILQTCRRDHQSHPVLGGADAKNAHNTYTHVISFILTATPEAARMSLCPLHTQQHGVLSERRIPSLFNTLYLFVLCCCKMSTKRR